MHLVIGNRLYAKDRIAAAISFLAGIIFLIGLVTHLIQIFSFAAVFHQMGKITCQSNLLALFTATVYLFNHNSKLLTTNFLPLLSISLLWFAGIGFWFILFPVYYIDLGNLIISENEKTAFGASFYAIWNHSITQLCFLVFFYFLNKKKNLWNLIPVKTKKMVLYVWYYIVLWIFWNIFMNLTMDVFPTYGILTNFNPYTSIRIQDSVIDLFSIRFLLFSHIACVSTAFILTTTFSLLAIKFRAIHQWELLESQGQFVAN